VEQNCKPLKLIKQTVAEGLKYTVNHKNVQNVSSCLEQCKNYKKINQDFAELLSQMYCLSFLWLAVYIFKTVRSYHKINISQFSDWQQYNSTIAGRSTFGGIRSRLAHASRKHSTAAATVSASRRLQYTRMLFSLKFSGSICDT